MRRSVAAVGRALVTLGLLILLFVGYQLWGTGVLQARAQEELEDEFAALRADVPAGATTTTGGSSATTSSPDTPTTGPTTTTAPPRLPPIQPGDPIGRLAIPEAGVDEIFVAGVTRSDLQKGPGHYPGTPLPGQRGNAAIAGHRTTYGAPFFDLDRLEPGDWIVTETLLGTHVYVVQWSEVVAPTDVYVVEPVPDDPRGAYLTLTTCNPRYSARERLVVRAALLDPGAVDESGDAPEERDAAVDRVDIDGGGATLAELPGFEDGDALTLEEGLEGDQASLVPTVLWGAVAGVVGLAWWWAFRRYRLLATWLVGVVPFLAAVLVFYVYLERLLPAGY